jgi:hypothetical protein
MTTETTTTRRTSWKAEFEGPGLRWVTIAYCAAPGEYPPEVEGENYDDQFQKMGAAGLIEAGFDFDIAEGYHPIQPGWYMAVENGDMEPKFGRLNADTFLGAVDEAIHVDEAIDVLGAVDEAIHLPKP